MNIFVTGASGFIGRNIVRRLVEAGHYIKLTTSSPITLESTPNMQWVTVAYSHNPDDWMQHLSGVEVVINCLGIIKPTIGRTFKSTHTDLPIALFTASQRCGVKKIIQISALGAADDAVEFLSSKKQADDFLQNIDIDYAIIRPSIVYGPGAKSWEMFGGISVLPIVPLLDRGQQHIQPIHIDDLTQLVIRLIDNTKVNHCIVNAVGSESITMQTLYSLLRQWYGVTSAKSSQEVRLPYRVMRVLATLAERISPMPITADAVKMLQQDNVANVEPVTALLGYTPTSVKQFLNNHPASHADVHYAKLYFVAPLLRWSLAVLWIMTGVVSLFVYPVENSLKMLSAVGITGSLAEISLYAAAVLDIVLGIALLIKLQLQRVAQLQIAMMLTYSVVISWSLPEYWAHPFGPMIKNLPIIVSMIIMMILERKPKWNI